MKLLPDLFGQLYEAWVFYILGYIFQSDRCLVFGILNYQSSLFMVSIIRHRSKIHTAGSAEDVYILIIVQSTWEALPAVIHILIGIIPVYVPFVFILPLIEIVRTQFFVRWMECNTPLPEYVLSYVFRFFDRIF